MNSTSVTFRFWKWKGKVVPAWSVCNVYIGKYILKEVHDNVKVSHGEDGSERGTSHSHSASQLKTGHLVKIAVSKLFRTFMAMRALVGSGGGAVDGRRQNTARHTVAMATPPPPSSTTHVTQEIDEINTLEME